MQLDTIWNMIKTVIIQRINNRENMENRFDTIPSPVYKDGDVYYGQLEEDGFSGDISKSSFTQTEKDVVVG